MDKIEIKNLGELQVKKANYGLNPPKLVEVSLNRGEGCLSDKGALCVMTGKYTGRAAKDKYVVDTPLTHEDVNWGEVNKSMPPERASRLFQKALRHLREREVFVVDGHAGAREEYAYSFRVVCEYASQALFIHQLLRRSERAALAQPDFTIICVPDMVCDPETDGTNGAAAVVFDFDNGLVLIAGTRYAGEIKKSVFTVMNYMLPSRGVLPMHCSANVGSDGDTALFFGLSGTGKTTLSTDPQRRLIGDDEHGWAEGCVFNFEGGCYAKCANLSEEKEPEIYNAVRFGALVENVVLNAKTASPDFDDLSVTENTRTGYPLEFLDNIQPSGSVSAEPKTIIFLTADAYGVLPPISKLTKEQAMYFFASGFTSKVAGTEVGITEPVPTFSACFGEPFLPLHPAVYVKMLADRLSRSDAGIYLINTGWNGTGKRIKLSYTRAMVRAAISGELERGSFVKDRFFALSYPAFCTGVPADLLDIALTWSDQNEYESRARKLLELFEKNFSKYTDMPDEVRAFAASHT